MAEEEEEAVGRLEADAAEEEWGPSAGELPIKQHAGGGRGEVAEQQSVEEEWARVHQRGAGRKVVGGGRRGSGGGTSAGGRGRAGVGEEQHVEGLPVWVRADLVPKPISSDQSYRTPDYEGSFGPILTTFPLLYQ